MVVHAVVCGETVAGRSLDRAGSEIEPHFCLLCLITISYRLCFVTESISDCLPHYSYVLVNRCKYFGGLYTGVYIIIIC